MMHFKIRKKSNKDNISIFVLLIMASGGLSIGTIGTTSITLFYIVGAFTIVAWLIKHPLIDKFQMQILLWSAVTIGISFVLIKNTKIISIFHFAFYVVAAISIFGTCNITKNVIEKLTKILIYANLVNILIAFVLYNIGISDIPIIFSTYFDRGVMRYMGFTSEPSYLAMESTVCILAYISIGVLNANRFSKEAKGMRYLLIAYVATIILSQTSFGLLSIVFAGLAWFQNRIGFKSAKISIILWFAVGIIGIVGVGIAVMYFSDSIFLSRILLIFNLLFSSHSIHEFQTNLRIIDSSAWYRIGPLLLAIDEARWTSFTTLFGHGIAADAEYYTLLTNSNTVIRGGFLQAGFYNQGIIGLVSFLILIIRKCGRIGILNIVYLLLCFCNCSISTQAFWFILIIYIGTSKLTTSNERFWE